jgi:hypothetical protein
MRAYVFFSVLEEFFYLICQRLIADGSLSDIFGTVWGDRSAGLLQGRGMDVQKLLVLSQVFEQLPKDLDYQFLRTYEDLAEGVPVPLAMAADRVVCTRPYKEGLAHVEAVLRAVECVFDQYSPDMLLTDDIACIPSYAHYLVAKRRGIPVTILGNSRLPGRLAVYSNPFAVPEEMVREYGRIKAEGLGQQERATARAYIDSFRDHATEIDYMAYMARLPALGLRELSVLWKLWSTYREDPLDYTAIRPRRAIADRLLRILRYRLLRSGYEQPVAGENYVLFPLHYQPEASTSVRAPFFVDQCALAENIAKALPAGYRLYVKEHAARMGARSIRDVQRLSAIPSVRLISPHADTRALIRNSACVATITSTMGWEALLLGVPTVLFGEAFYGSCEDVLRAGAPREYPQLFRQALSQLPREDVLEQFVAAVLNTTFLGCMGHPYYLPGVLAQDNIRQIADHLAKNCLAEIPA